MVSVLKNLYETEVQKGESRLVLVLRWREAGISYRNIQAETFRVAARVCEGSQDERWVVDAEVGCGIIGRGLLATLVTIELADGTDAEMARAAVLLLNTEHDIRS